MYLSFGKEAAMFKIKLHKSLNKVHQDDFVPNMGVGSFSLSIKQCH